jgi:hypothetical protein
MKRILVLLVAAAAVSWAADPASASYCGAARFRCCQSACCPAQQCYTVMKTCKKIEYVPYEVTQYRSVFVEVVDKKEIDTVEFKPDTEERMLPTTVMETRECTCMQPTCAHCSCATHGCLRRHCGCAQTACCQPVTCTCQVPVTCLKKVWVGVVRELPVKKIVEHPRIVEKKVPETITCYRCQEVCVQVPVTVCCPVPRCGSAGQPACSACGQ